MDFLNDLNNAQRLSVEYLSGPLMVIAGAGSGKTRVLTYKIAYLIQQGWKPYNILALTFTNKAAGEMKQRIGQLVGEELAKQVWMGTFHSVFAKILRREADKLNYLSNFTIYDTEDSKKIITDIIKRMQLDDKNKYKPASVLARISDCKNKMISPSVYEMRSDLLIQDKQSQREYFIEIYKAYQKQLHKNSAMDFDDLLYYTNVLFRDFPDTLAKYQNAFQYILVDEFQDTNFSQYLSVKALAKNHQNICVVGDDAQSIYSFRGADINNIVTNFRKDFPTHRLFKLEENYRSTKYIVEASNAIIRRNKNQIPKKVYTNNPKGDPLHLYINGDGQEEAYTIAKEVVNLKKNGVLYEDITILYRTNAQSRLFEDAFRFYQIPYKIVSGMSFYQRKEIKDVIAYFKVVLNPRDEEALLRIINYPSRGIGDTALERIRNYAFDNEVSIFDLLTNVRILQNELQFSNKQIQSIEHFTTHIIGFQNYLFEKDAFTLAKEIIDFSGIIKHLEQAPTEDNKERVLNINELLNAIDQFSKTERTLSDEIPNAGLLEDLPNYRTLDEFVREVSLLTSQDEKDKNGNNNAVRLMTIHNSKGLEFPYVFIVGLEEGLFPSGRSMFEDEIEEERRLFYVAITRAKEKVYLSFAKKRFLNGRTAFTTPSRFINELPQEYINIKGFNNKNQDTYYSSAYDDIPSYPKKEIEQQRPSSPRKLVSIKEANTSASILKNNEDTLQNKNLRIGDTVYHDKFGKGIILNISGNWPDSKAIIQFDTQGQKVLLLKFAKLTKV